MARPSRSAMYADDGTFLWKPILRFLAILLAIVGIGTTAWAMTSRIHRPDSDSATSGSDPGDYEYDFSYDLLPWQFITLGLSILWNIANMVTLLIRNRAIHPGANVACDLLLWLGLLVTAGFATLGGTNYLYYYAYDDYSYDSGSSYGGGTYSNGTRFEYTANGTAVALANSQCDGFTTCAARDQYESAVRHKGVVIIVGASVAFVVLLFHFALFISACRYTHDRRHTNTNRQARAITAEATEIARRMIADMTGPNGTFIPKNQAQQAGGSYQPIHQQSDLGEAMEMRQRQSRSQPGYDYQPVQQGEVEERGQGEQHLSREGVIPRRYEQQMGGAGPSPPTVGSASFSPAAMRRDMRTLGSGPEGETHPAFRDDPNTIAHAM